MPRFSVPQKLGMVAHIPVIQYLRGWSRRFTSSSSTWVISRLDWALWDPIEKQNKKQSQQQQKPNFNSEQLSLGFWSFTKCSCMCGCLHDYSPCALSHQKATASLSQGPWTPPRHYCEHTSYSSIYCLRGLHRRPQANSAKNHMLCETSQQKGNSHVLGRVIPVVLGIYSLDMCIKVHKDKFNLCPMHCRRGKKQTTRIHTSRYPESDRKRSNHPPRKKIVNYVPARAWNTMQPLRLSPYQQRKISMIHYSLKKNKLQARHGNAHL